MSPARLDSQACRRRLVAGFVLALGGCGFKLRGAVDLPFDAMFVDGLPYSPFTGQLKRDIAASGRTRVTERAEGARATLHLLGELQERAILAISGGGRVRELQLRYRVNFRVRDVSGREWLPTNEVLVVRDMTFDDSLALAKEAEAQALFKEMQADAAQQVLRRIQAIRGFSAEEEG